MLRADEVMHLAGQGKDVRIFDFGTDVMHMLDGGELYAVTLDEVAAIVDKKVAGGYKIEDADVSMCLELLDIVSDENEHARRAMMKKASELSHKIRCDACKFFVPKSKENGYCDAMNRETESGSKCMSFRE